MNRKQIEILPGSERRKGVIMLVIQDLGDQLTPKGLNATQYWVEEKGQGNFIEGVKAYANAICDSIEKSILMVLILTTNLDMDIPEL